MAQQHTICPRCAKRLPPSARFCRRCGMTQKVSASAAAGATAAGFGASGYTPRTAPPPYAAMPPARPASGRPKRPPTRGPSPVGTGSWSGARGGWIVALLVIFVVRACITSTTSHWHSEPAPPPPLPPISIPQFQSNPNPEWDDRRWPERHTDPFDRHYFPDHTVAPESPDSPAPSQPPVTTDRPNE